jgi:Fe2+ transport system protein FeoA
MQVRGTKEDKTCICGPGRNDRILNSDYYGRSFRVLPFQRPIKAWESVGLSVLTELNVGESAVLVGLDLPESVQNHLMHMGFVPDALVTVLRRAPAGDPTVYAVDGMEIALRRETAAAIRMRAPEAEVQHAEYENAHELVEAAR